MSDIRYQRITAEEIRIYHDDHCVGDVYLYEDITRPGSPPVFVIHLESDPRGPHRVHDRDRVRDAVRQRLQTHPLF